MNNFDLITFLKTVRRRWKLIAVNAFVAAAAGLVIAFSIPRQYTASVSLAPELSEEGGGLSGSLGKIASLGGFDLGGGTDAIGPALYPDVIGTNDFLVKLLGVSVTTDEGGQMDFKTYLTKHTRIPWWGYVKVGLGKLIKMMRPAKKKRQLGGGEDPGAMNPKCLSEEEEQLVTSLRGAVYCKVDDESGVVGVSVTTQDPLVSMQIADSVVNHLQGFITRYRTSKACNDLVYYRGLEKEAAAKYELAKRKYAAYCDSHQDLALQSYRTEQESLENELQMAFTAYSQIRQQVQMAEAKVQEKTPAFTMLEDSSVPNAPVAPRKVLILFGCIFLGVLGTLGWIYVRLLFPPAAADGQTEAARIKNEVKE